MYKGLRMQVLLLRGALANSGVEVHTMNYCDSPVVALLLEQAYRDLVKNGFAYGLFGDRSEDWIMMQVSILIEEQRLHQDFVIDNSGNLAQYCGWHTDKIQLLCRLIGGLKVVPCSMLINGFRVELEKVTESYPSLS